ncbi:uncharacterized protein C2orf50 homolog [Alligator sinensis]|uniref:Uncharacterized protein C2orf50 homolog n=1 Tax=Alligator sinensis TaxID=38654 RepID=A0A3Q0GDF0_ALLSI|nr:uncharacterized protein C2orf50 homolog [Alligator sinensis]
MRVDTHTMGSRSPGFRNTSAGYQLSATKSLVELASSSSSSPAFSSTQLGRAVTATKAARAREEEQVALQQDQVRQDKIWREFVEAEWRGRKCWYQNWSFLKDYDPLGKKKEQKPLPKFVSVFSETIPNTTNQTIGSRMNTELGRMLVNMDYFINSGGRKKKLENELQPC